MKKILMYICIFALVLSASACKKEEITNTKPTQKEQSEVAETETLIIKDADLKFLDEFDYTVDVPFNEVEFSPKVPGYNVAADLSNVVNLESFREFSQSQKDKLVESGFFIAPVSLDTTGGIVGNNLSEQMFYIYEDNEYKILPSFITTDSVLHMYHIFYDNFLKNLEENTLFDKLIELNDHMLTASITTYENLANEEVKNLALKNTAFFGTAQLLLGEKLPENMPEEANILAHGELKKINSQSGSQSEILEIKLDYSQFKPRGHYTKSETLQKYFKTVMYFGQCGFFAQEDGKRREDLTAMAMLISHDIFANQDSFKLYSDIYDPMNFLVDGADDLGPKEYAKLLYGIYGKAPDLNDLMTQMDSVYANLENFDLPQIGGFLGRSFRFMPQRAVLDSVWMQNLVDVNIPSERPVFKGLDVMAVMGNDTAKKLELADGYNKFWDKYPDKLRETTEKVSLMSDRDWMKNLYRGWLWTLSELKGDYDEGYPDFMKNDDWNKKELNTALGSYAELKHDTVLYGKEVIAEMGGGGYEELPKSYVEPNVKLYEKLSWLIEFTTENLKLKNLLTDIDIENLEYFKNLCDLLKNVSIKELNNEMLTEEEYLELYYIGGAMEAISLRFVNDYSTYWSLIDENDRNMTIVSDLMKVVANTADVPEGEYLHAAVGPAYEIYVIYPVGDELHMGRGGVFSYREFLNETRLNNEEYREIIKDDLEYGTPDWFTDMVQEPKIEIPDPYYSY
ncbi:Hypothetical protein ING2D1G_1399 [Peptoniphilus sp. ING2-D1G]|nr:Hypothetical protein ING2D1G_1399 [Peptoniphilus sp. ING2-D1G]